MILFFDTETTGKADFNLRASDPAQPHIVQLATVITSDDGREVEVHKMLVKPEGWEIPVEATAIHGITTEFATAHGQSESVVAGILFGMLKHCTLSVAHNHQFDKFIARIAARRHGLLSDDQNDWWKALPTFCTMREMTDIVGIPGNYGKCKWPKLSEAYEFCFGRQLNGAHDALVDVRACAEIYFWHRKQAGKGVV